MRVLPVVIGTASPSVAEESVQIVRLAPREWRAYRELRLRALRDDPGAFGASHDEFAARPAAYWRDRLQAAAEEQTDWLLFARRGGRSGGGDASQLVGMVGAMLNRHVPDADDADVISMYVAPEERGRGIAALLLDALLAALRESGTVRRVGLYVNAEQGAAVRLYERAGFSITGRTRGRLGDGNEHDLLHMERPLGAQ